MRRGNVRWDGASGESPEDAADGIRSGGTRGRRVWPRRPFRRLLWQQRLRRAGLILAGLLAIAAASYALVWMLEAFRVYDPKYYEPKDMERQQFEKRPGIPGR